MSVLPPGVDVLVVDDDADLRQLLRSLLEDTGYRVYEAPDGASALACLNTHAHRLVVLCDWCLPDMDGEALLRAVAADLPDARRNAYILLTGYAGAGGPPLSHGCARVLRHLDVKIMGKPFDVERLLDALRCAQEQLVGR
ncbi:MAG TPA: response regulator [Ktedonobacterales bacterium]|nr:response regulator [Ktedonobacterales bacterium]